MALFAGQFQQRLVAGEMAALREIEGAIKRAFANIGDRGGGLPRGGAEILQPHMGQFGVRREAEFGDDGGKAWRAVMGFENGRLRRLLRAR